MIDRRSFLAATAAAAIAPLAPARGESLITGSARQNGFYLPEETEPHLRTFMQWPVSREVHSDRYFLRMLQSSVADIANTISEFEPVAMLMDPAHERQARKLLDRRIEIWPVATDDLWCRDSGPIFVTDGAGRLAVSELNFNGWGNRQIHDNDGKIARKLAAGLGLHVFNNGVVGEGGGVETDGYQTLIAHESSWVNPNRNNGTRQDVEARLLDALGAQKIIWAPGIVGGDITDYHIDALARFVSPGLVLMQLPERRDPENPWSMAAYETYDILSNATDRSGQKLEVVTVPEPKHPRVKSPDFVASYVNYYVCNGAVISAQFGDGDADKEAASVLRDLYPDREIVALNIDPIGESGGGIHCATQQQPRV
ncbi:agmatine/peptidylarginine deiminase [Hoeflea sp. TYP-13]|uniref:agmatine/peptidylarginine deiminase n=1 Tax=Hoeflea sp. TYP-13 TaxID=3230023 RepID=UPI0034C60A75